MVCFLGSGVPSEEVLHESSRNRAKKPARYFIFISLVDTLLKNSKDYLPPTPIENATLVGVEEEDSDESGRGALAVLFSTTPGSGRVPG